MSVAAALDNTSRLCCRGEQLVRSRLRMRRAGHQGSAHATHEPSLDA